MYGFVRRLQPATLLGNRIEPSPNDPAHGKVPGNAAASSSFYEAPDTVGDFAVREAMIGDFETNKAWDSCISVNSMGWAWVLPLKLRPLDEILNWLIQSIGRDGGMLLGVGPRPDGTIDPGSSTRLLELGDWLKLNGEAVYGTRGGPYLPGDWGVSTRKGDKVYLFVQRWKGDTVKLPALAAKVKSARLITRGTVTFEQGDSGLVVRVPEAFHRPVATIIELALDEDAMKLPVVEVPKRKNFALNKPVEVSSVWPGRSEQELNPKNVTDGVPETIWAAEEKARDGWVTVDLQNECEICEALLSDAPYGRTQQFDLEAKINGQWKRIAAGTSIGSALHLDFPPVRARLFRLNIRKASDTPVVAEFQLFGKQ